MYQFDEFEIWNLTPGVPAMNGAQGIFNVVGSLRRPANIKKFFWALNGGPEKIIFFNNNPGSLGRLQYQGDFNIDTILSKDLATTNELTFRIVKDTLEEKKYHIAFSTCSGVRGLPCFQLDLEGAEHAEQVGQMVDGKWQVHRDETGKPCLEIERQDSGLDRIILFGRQEWTTGYQITARLCVTSWVLKPHSVGLVFKWNAHLQGDGTCIPRQWSTGLGYYCSHYPGLRIRFGVNVHTNKHGKKVGDFMLQEGMLSLWRCWIGKIFDNRWSRYVASRIVPVEHPFTQLVCGKQYQFRMVVHPEQYTLTVWEAERREPSPSLVVQGPIDEKLPSGSVGIIANKCGVRLYDFNVSPLV